MTRRLVIAACLVGVTGASAATAVAATAPRVNNPSQHELCVVLVKSKDGSHTQDYCINWG